jgi:hypothetical protein
MGAMIHTRRDLIVRCMALVVGAAGCSSDRKLEPESGGLAARFAQYQAAPEPNGDLSKIVWPAYVTKAGPEVKRLYEFQVTHGELMRYMPCFCGCGDFAGHRSNRDCYVREVKEDGSVVFDSMAPT